MLLGNAEPAFTIVDKAALDHDPQTGQADRRRTSSAPISCSTRPAGRSGSRRHPRKDGIKLAPKGLLHRERQLGRGGRGHPGLSAQDRRRLAAAGLGSRPSPRPRWRSRTHEIWSVTVPYLSAGDLMNIYFDSRNIPTPNRMNWKDERDRPVADAGPHRAHRGGSRQVLRPGAGQVMHEHLWMPRAQHQPLSGDQQEAQGCAAAHALCQHLLQGTGFEFLTIRHDGLGGSDDA